MMHLHIKDLHVRRGHRTEMPFCKDLSMRWNTGPMATVVLRTNISKEKVWCMQYFCFKHTGNTT